MGLGYPLIFYSVSELPVLPFFAATFRPVFGIAAHRTYPDGAVADTGRSRRQYGPRFPGSLRRRNVEPLFSRKDNLKHVLMNYEIFILSCLQTIHPKKCAPIFLRRRLPEGGCLLK